MWPQCISFLLLYNIPVHKAATGYSSILGSTNILFVSRLGLSQASLSQTFWYSSLDG